MNVGQAIAQIQLLMGFRSDLATQAKTQLELAQDQYERGPIYPWFLLSEIQTFVTSIGERRVPLPADFISENEEAALFYDDDEGDDAGEAFQLGKHDYDYLVKEWGLLAKGTPQAYAVQGEYFILFPVPDALYTISIQVYKKDTKISSLSNDATNKWLDKAPDCIIGKAGQMLATAARDTIATQAFMAMEQKGQAQLQIDNEARKHTNRQYQIGGPHV